MYVVETKIFHLHLIIRPFGSTTLACQFYFTNRIVFSLVSLFCVYLSLFGIYGSNVCNFSTFAVESTTKLMNYSFEPIVGSFCTLFLLRQKLSSFFYTIFVNYCLSSEREIATLMYFELQESTSDPLED